MLSDSDSDADGREDLELTINEHYEKTFNVRKEREEMWRLEEKLGSEAESTDSEDGVEEDEEGDELTPAADAAIFKTLAKIRDRDPVIYEKDVNVFQEEESRLTGKYSAKKKAKGKEKDTKPLTIKKHLLNSLLNPNGEDGDVPQPPTYVQEQAALRTEMVEAFRTAVADENEEDDGLLVLREKAQPEEEGEMYGDFLQREAGEEIKRFLGGVGERSDETGANDENVDEEEDSGKKKKKKKKKEAKDSAESSKDGKKIKDKEKEDQDFLMDYILNRGWIDKSKDKVPTYKDITGGDEELDEIEKEDEFDEVAEEFETSYNFRFEEPDATKIASFPRNIPSLLRRPNTTRVEARQRRNERKEEKLLEKREEVKRLKALRVKHMREKLERIGKEGGIDIKDLEEVGVDLDGDWDPTKHDQQMAGLYEREEGEDVEDAESEDGKPTWDDDINIADIDTTQASSSKSKKKKKKKDKEGEVEDGVDIDEMDADLVNGIDGAEEEWDGSEEMRKEKLDDYIESLYGMEFNDLIGDTPTRFHYTPVPASSFALTPAEIILADDKDLNSYVSLRKIAPYRKGKLKSGWDAKLSDRLQEFREGMKQKGRFWRGADGGYQGMRDRQKRKDWTGETGEDRPKKKRKGKKERLREKAEVGVDEG